MGAAIEVLAFCREKLMFVVFLLAATFTVTIDPFGRSKRPIKIKFRRRDCPYDEFAVVGARAPPRRGDGVAVASEKDRRIVAMLYRWHDCPSAGDWLWYLWWFGRPAPPAAVQLIFFQRNATAVGARVELSGIGLAGLGARSVTCGEPPQTVTRANKRLEGFAAHDLVSDFRPPLGQVPAEPTVFS